MSETIHDRVQQLIEARGVSTREAERMSGLGDGTISKILKNRDQYPHARTVGAIAKAFGVTEYWLSSGADAPAPDVRGYGPGSAPPIPTRDEMPNDVPVMGTAAGSHLRGAFKLGSDPVDWVRRPPALMRNKDAYALYVENTSMEPQYFAGDLIFVNPTRPARIGDIVVVQVVDDDGGSEGTLGIFLKRTETVVVIGKRNPPAEVEIKRTATIRVHKVMSNNELFGI